MGKTKAETNRLSLLKGLQEGDSQGIQSIYDACFVNIQNHILRNKGTHQDAEDVFHEGLLVLCLKLEKGLELKVNLPAYLFGIAKNIWLKKLRKQSNMVDLPAKDLLIDDMQDIEKELHRVETYQFFREKLRSLSAGCQQVLACSFEEMSLQQIADHLGFASANYAKKRKSLCKKKLKELIRSDARYKEFL